MSAINQTADLRSKSSLKGASAPSADDADLVLIVAQAREGVAAAWETLIGRFGGTGRGNRQTMPVERCRRCGSLSNDMAEACRKP